METTSFILGIGSVVLVTLASLVIYNTIKVYKMQKELERMNRDYYDMLSSFSRSLDETRNNIYDTISSDRREIFTQLEKLETSKKK
jgi:cell division protein FtsL